MRYVLAITFLLFALRRLLTYLHIYQQEEYQPIRFVRWLYSSRSLDITVSLIIVLFGLLEFTIHLPFDTGAVVISAVFLVTAIREKDPRAASKKRLNMTGRATRIYWIGFALLATIAVLYTLPGVPLEAWLIPVQCVPLALVGANLLLTPYERHIQQGFWNEAHTKLRNLRPKVIGITGSFGKTSTKHLLGHILEVQAPTLITPGSVNTPMGIARIIRERLSPHHRFFVCEMGAYGPGSIARLCRLAPPDVGVLTAIGMAHYERFKTLDTVAKAKLELAESVASRQGDVVLHEQVLSFAASQAFQTRYFAKTHVVGEARDSAFRLTDARQTQDGIEVQISWRGEVHTVRAPIFGEHHIGNMALAFATACTLGISPADAVTALASAPQIAHRLEVKVGVNGSRLIDDAYNSNPVGFASALRLLSTLNTKGGRRILVTPGMVELGAAHGEEHRRIGELAGAHVDVLLPVLPARITALTTAYTAANPAGLVIPCLDFPTAQTWLNNNTTSADVVLLENDLPDLYEKKLRL